MTLFLRNIHIIDRGLFTFVFNSFAALFGRSVRVKWHGDNLIMRDSRSPSVNYRFRHQNIGVVSYGRGFVNRVKILERTYFLNQIDFEDGDIFLDCGANVGDIKLCFRFNNTNIEYIGFEPSPVEFECLKHNVAPSKAFNVGLWKSEGVLPFYVSPQMADSSFIEPTKYDEIIQIPVKRLEEFITKPVKCLKLEAEGGEPEVLEGIGDKLEQIEYITADLGPERGINMESTFIPVTNFLLGRGFVLQDWGGVRLCALYRNTKFDRPAVN